YFLEVGNDIVDFSVGDWRETPLPDVKPAGYLVDLPSPQWNTSPPEFFWADKTTFASEPGKNTPDIARAWYTGFRGAVPDMTQLTSGFIQNELVWIKGALKHGIEVYALSERVAGREARG